MSAINKINVDNVSYNIEDSRVDNIADSIPTASTEQKGLVQIGQGINVDENGVISVEASGGDSVSYNDTSAALSSSTIVGYLNINGTDYTIAAPTASYLTSVGDETNHITLGFVADGTGANYEVIAPAVSYNDQTQGTNALGVLIVGDNQYPITYTPAASGDSVQFNSLLASGTQIGTITINGVETAIYAPSGGGSGGGSTVSYQDLTSSTDARVAVGMITIDGAGYNIYVPTTVDWNDITNKPTIPTATSQLTNDSGFITSGDARDIVADQISNTSIYDLQNVPAVIGDVSGLTVTPDPSSGTKIATIAWVDSSGIQSQDLYAPAGGSGSVEPHFEVEIADDRQSGLTEAIVSYVGDPMESQVGGEFWNDSNFIKACNNPVIITRTDYTFKTIGIATFDTMEGYYLWITLANPTYGTTNDAGSIAIGRLAATLAWDDVNNELVFESVNLLRGFDATEVESLLQTGTPIANIKTNNNTTTIYAPAGGSGGDTVTVTPAVYSGTKIADIDVSGTTTSLYAPAGGSGGSTDWADITGNKPYLYQGYRSTSVQQSPTQYTPSTLPGYGTAATGDYSIAIGYDTQATNHCSLAVGGSTRSKGMWSVATGDGTIAAGDRQIAAGTYNAEDANNYFAFMVGNGDYKSGGSTTIRKNAEATAWNGNKYIEGNLYVGCTDWATVNSSSSGTGKPELVTENAGGKRVLTEDDIPSVVGDTVTITQTLTSGTKIAEIDVSGTTTDIYAPAGGATDWADITNKPDITPVAGRDGINNIAGLGGSVNQSQGVNPKGTIVIGDGARSSADNAVALGAGATVTGLNGAAIGWGAQAGRDSIALGTGSQASSYGAALGWGAVARSQYQTAIGVNNIVDANGQFGLIVGNGITPDGSILPPSDAMAIGFNGTQYLAGDLYVNCTDFTTTSNGLTTTNCGGTKVATLSDIKADWAITDASASGYIANKPAIKAGSGSNAVAEGYNTTASGNNSHAEGNGTTASGNNSHAEGNHTEATGINSHAEGSYTVAFGTGSHAEGGSSHAQSDYSHAEGMTFANSKYQHTQGKYNVADYYNVFADIIGNGTNSIPSAASNAEATDWNGNKYLSGGIYVGCTDYTTTANGLTTLGAGGFRIDMATGYEDNVQDPTEPDETYSEELVMIDTITKTMGSEMQEDPETGDMIPVATTVTTTHQRNWTALPKEYTARDLAVDIGNLGGMNPADGSFNEGGIYTLQIWSVKQYLDDGEGNITEYYTPEYRWVKTAETTPEDAEEPTPEEPTE